MPKNYLLRVFMSCCIFCSIESWAKDEATNGQELCPDKASCEDLNNSCKCYCAVGCSPRDKIKDKDDPIFVQDKDNPKGKCWCKSWDMKNYDSNKCPQKNTGQEMCATKAQCGNFSESCQCYDSDLCSFRDKSKKKGDRPEIITTKKEVPLKERCWCSRKELDEYESKKNKCSQKDIEKKVGNK